MKTRVVQSVELDKTSLTLEEHNFGHGIKDYTVTIAHQSGNRNSINLVLPTRSDIEAMQRLNWLLDALGTKEQRKHRNLTY